MALRFSSLTRAISSIQALRAHTDVIRELLIMLIPGAFWLVYPEPPPPPAGAPPPAAPPTIPEIAPMNSESASVST